MIMGAAAIDRRSTSMMKSLMIALTVFIALRPGYAHCQRLTDHATVATAAATLTFVFGATSAAPGRGPLADEVADDWESSDTAREQELQRLKQGILEGLGLKKLPDTSKMNVSRKEYDKMYQVYLNAVAANNKLRQSDDMAPEEEDDFIKPRLNTRRYYTFTYDDGDLKGRNRRSPPSNDKNGTAIYFPLEIPEARWRHRDASVRRATLRLLITSTGLRTLSEGVLINVFQPSSRPGVLPTLLEQRQVILTPGQDGVSSRWTDFDVTSAVSEWLRDPTLNKGLLIECHRCKFPTHVSANDSGVKPVLNVMINVRGQYSRLKRSYDVMSPKRRGRTDCRKDGERCCRHQMEVVFDELKGFEFILQPKKFDAGFCKGRCPPRYNPAHHHALLQSLIWKQNRKLAPKPCCAPSKLKSLDILHLDEDDPTRLKVSHWENIEVTECACS